MIKNPKIESYVYADWWSEFVVWPNFIIRKTSDERHVVPKLTATQLFVQQLVQCNTKNIKLYITGYY